MILKYKIHYKFYCLVYFIMIYLLYTDTRLGRLWLVQIDYTIVVDIFYSDHNYN